MNRRALENSLFSLDDLLVGRHALKAAYIPKRELCQTSQRKSLAQSFRYARHHRYLHAPGRARVRSAVIELHGFVRL